MKRFGSIMLVIFISSIVYSIAMQKTPGSPIVQKKLLVMKY